MAETQAQAPVADTITADQNPLPVETSTNRYKWWIQMVVYSIFLLAGQAAGTLLGRVYFNNGGSSQWLVSLMQICGFPILIPFRWLKTPGQRPIQIRRKKFPILLIPIYVAAGVISAGLSLLYTVGIHYLPVTTFTLITATQLGFNAFFSYFLNGQKLTPYIVNSLLLLTISSVLLVFSPENEGSNAPSKNKHAIGFVCTLAGSAAYGFLMAATQLVFHKIIKRETIAAVIDMSVYQGLVASLLIGVGFVASGDWRKLNSEMKGYKSGTTSYVMTLLWTAICWQVFMVGCIGLVFRISALFSNVISILGTPLSPVLAVVFLGENMNGVKGISMVLAMWGFVSYMYQHYLDDLEMKKKMTMGKEGDEEEAMAVELIK